MKVHKDLRCLGAFLVFPGRNWKHLHVSCQFSDRSFLLHCPPCKLCWFLVGTWGKSGHIRIRPLAAKRWCFAEAVARVVRSRCLLIREISRYLQCQCWTIEVSANSFSSWIFSLPGCNSILYNCSVSGHVKETGFEQILIEIHAEHVQKIARAKHANSKTSKPHRATAVLALLGFSGSSGGSGLLIASPRSLSCWLNNYSHWCLDFKHLWDCSDGLLWRHTTILISIWRGIWFVGLFCVFVTQDHNFISCDKSSYSFDMWCSDTQVPCARGNAVSVSSSISFCTIFHVITSLLGAWMECGAVAFWEKTWHKAAMHPNRCFCIGNNSVKAGRSMLSQDETKPNNQHGVLHKTYTASVHLRISKISKISSDLVIALTCPFHPLSLVRLESEACHRGWERKSRNRITAPRGPNFSRTPSAKVFRCTWVNVKTCCFCSASYEERCAHEMYPCTRSRDKFIR